MTNPLAQDLGGVVLDGVRFEIVKVACRDEPGACGLRIHIDHQSFDIGRGFDDSEHAEWMAKQFSSALNRLVARTHSAEIAGALRDAEGWRPIESAPRDGTAILGLWMPSPGAYTRVSGNNYGIVAFDDERGFWALVDDGDEPDEVMRPDYWRPLPAPPTHDSAMQHGGGGGE